MFYLANTPLWMRILFPPGVVWNGDSSNNKVYLTFDDGPTPAVTDFVLNELAKYGYKATFFCIGKNVKNHPDLFKKLQTAGHRVGNHTMHHANGWRTKTAEYLAEIIDANKLIRSDLFRPPYGKITRAQAAQLRKGCQTTDDLRQMDLEGMSDLPSKIIMWSVITGDFDTEIDGDTCFNQLVKFTKPGGIIVFHDSEKAFPRLKIALPKTLAWIQAQGLQPVVIE